MSYLPDTLRGKTVLLVEDAYNLADHFQAIVESAGGRIDGPFGSAAGALDRLSGEPCGIAVASLDVTLLDGKVWAVADRLAALDIPFLFASGGDPEEIPDRFARTPLVRKPLSPDQLVGALVNIAH